MIKIKYNKKTLLKALVYILELLALALFIYLIFLPVYPLLKYRLGDYNNYNEAKEIEKVEEKTSAIINSLRESEYAISPNRLIITKIGVNAPIIQTDNEEYGLSMGAWLVPEGSTPDQGGNTIITGHRFKYLPPNNLTFYLFDKLEAGDIVSVIWKEEKYFYRIKEVKIVSKTDFSVLDPSNDSILTMFTCHPLYSTEKRLVVIAELIKKK